MMSVADSDDRQRDASAVEEPGEDVAPGARLDAERVVPGDARVQPAVREAAVGAHQLRVVRERVDAEQLGDQRREGRKQQDDDDPDQGSHGHLVAPEAATRRSG